MAIEDFILDFPHLAYLNSFEEGEDIITDITYSFVNEYFALSVLITAYRFGDVNQPIQYSGYLPQSANAWSSSNTNNIVTFNVLRNSFIKFI
jgi:hypothetical protein